jgi:putative FmdB family regulatory protein
MRFAPGAKEVHMPIYEYDCLDCRRRVNVFFRTFAEADAGAARCPACQGANLRRLVSRVTVLRSEDSRLDSLADESMMTGLENEDPRAIAGMMRKMSDEMGEPLDPEMHEVVQRLERGESPESIEQSMPNLGTENDDAGGLGEGYGGDDL